MLLGPPITILTKLELLNNRKEIKNQIFFMNEEGSSPSKAPQDPSLNPSPYLIHKSILDFKDSEKSLKPYLKRY